MSIVQSIDEVGADKLERLNKLLAGFPGAVQKVSHNALKRAGDAAKTKAGQFAAEEYTITKGDFMKNVRVKTSIPRDSGSELSMVISYAGSVLPLLTFKTKYAKDGMLTTQVKRNSGAAVIKHAFAERVFGPIAVFERISKKRFPVEQKFGPSTAHMMGNEQVIEKMDEVIRETFEKRFEHEVLRIMNGW